MEEYRSAIRRIMIAVNTIDGVYALEARKIGLKENALSLLYALDDGKAHTQTQICEEWLIPKTTINTIVKECVTAGYVTLNAEANAREKLIRLTERGREYATSVLRQVYQVEQQAMDSAAHEFSYEFVDALESFATHMRSEYHKYFIERDEHE